MKNKNLAICVFCLIMVFGLTNSSYGRNFMSYGGHSYAVSNRWDSWFSVEAEAASMGGHLVTINDSNENAWLASTFDSRTTYWIGFTDKDTEGTWKWISGETSVYTNWAAGEPNSSLGDNEDAAAFNYNAPGEWADFSIDQGQPGIIELPYTDLVLIGLPAAKEFSNPAQAYQMIGIPYTNLINTSPSTNDTFDGLKNYFGGGYNPAKWRLYKQSGDNYAEITGSGQDTLEYGKGWWIISSDGAEIVVSGTPTSGPVSVPLVTGWNMVACPFSDKNVDWYNIFNDNANYALGLGQDIYHYEVIYGNYVLAYSMFPGVSYWVYASTPGNLVIQKTYTFEPSVSSVPETSSVHQKISQPPPLPPGAYIQVLSPNGNEVMRHRKLITIQWNASGIDPQGFTGGVTISLSTDGGNSFSSITENAANTGNYEWRIPRNIRSDACLMRISSTLYPELSDTSDSLFIIR